ncbi:hypothetical protein PIB30_113523, partial [Stylosanthes scabra]|nr:hypothetical protein [Stylosanthes scabra]
MVINVFEAMQHPADEETEECMRTDIIDMLVKEIQEEDMLKKSNAYYEETFATFNDTKLEFLVQNNKDELQEIEENKENQEEKDVETEEATIQKNAEEIQMEKDEVQEEQRMELKPLPSNLKYAYLDEDEHLPVIISSSLIQKEEEELLMILK